MPEVPDSFIRKEKESKSSAELIRWRTVTYRAVALWGGGVAAVGFVVVMALVPQWRAALFESVWRNNRAASNTVGNVIRQARFTRLEGAVRVRKANQVQ